VLLVDDVHAHGQVVAPRQMHDDHLLKGNPDHQPTTSATPWTRRAALNPCFTSLYTAARRGKVFKLTWADVDFANNRIRLFTRKRAGGNLEGDWVEMVGELRNALRWWWENRPHKDAEHVFTVHGGHNFENQHEGKPFQYRLHFMRKLCAKAGVKPFGFHAIRHLTASLLDMAGKELTIIQGVLRHQNPHTTARYLHSLRGLRAEMEDALPKPPGKVLRLKSKGETG